MIRRVVDGFAIRGGESWLIMSCGHKIRDIRPPTPIGVTEDCYLCAAEDRPPKLQEYADRFYWRGKWRDSNAKGAVAPPGKQPKNPTKRKVEI